MFILSLHTHCMAVVLAILNLDAAEYIPKIVRANSNRCSSRRMYVRNCNPASYTNMQERKIHGDTCRNTKLLIESSISFPSIESTIHRYM